MPETSNQQEFPTTEEILNHIKGGLNSASAQDRLAAIQELLGQNYSNQAILLILEGLALNDKSQAVREAARQALDSPTHRYIQGRKSTLNRRERQVILREVDNWKNQGLIQSEQADVLRQRYDFDLKPSAPGPEKAETAPPARARSAPIQAAASVGEQTKSSQASLAQTLLSETSIRIALYLGAFFVIAAAAILAAVLEAARLPILLAATAIFGVGAIAIKKLLPQPSFALFVVFSFLLPTDANVLADILSLSSRANAGYWFITMAVMALIWAFGTWFYTSRLFSLAAFTALAISFGRLGELLDAELEIFELLFSVVTLLGLGCAYVLKRWRDTRTSLPLFILTQCAQLALAVFAIITVLIRIDEGASAWNLLSTTFWLLTTGFYILSDLIFPFILFPWLAAAALYPVPLVFMETFDAGLPWYAGASWVWGSLMAVASQSLRRPSITTLHRYYLPTLIGSLLLLLTSVVFGFSEDIVYAFASLLAAALLCTLLHILQPRYYVWSTALLLGLGAYFTFFALPFMESLEITAGYQLLIASMLLLLPELILPPDLSLQRVWRAPARLLGGLLVLSNTLLLIFMGDRSRGETAIVFGVYAIVSALYAIRYRSIWLGYGATAFTALSVTFALRYFDLDVWLPVLTALSAFYFLGGLVLRRHGTNNTWSQLLRLSGLALAGLISLVALVTGEPSGGWYVLVTASLFTVELFLRDNGWLEIGAQFYFATALFMLLRDFDVREAAWYLLGIGLLWLTLDLVFGRTYSLLRPIRWPVRALGGLATAANTFYLLVDSTHQAGLAATCFGIYSAFFLLIAIFHRRAWLGYSLTLYTMLTLIEALIAFGQPDWLLPVTALGILFYAARFAWRKPDRVDLESWPFVLWSGGLGITLVASLAAPFKGGLGAVIPPAVAATMVAVEAFKRRNVWLGFPANALYLMAYFILLFEIQQDEPQFYSIATAALGLLMHYLLTRTGSKTGAFITGMISQLVLLGTTYIQFLSNEELAFFAILFFQALVVLVYGIVIRSRSLVITPIIFLVLDVLTVLFGLLQGIMTIFLIGCTGLLLILLGILAVVMRERWKQISERFGDWGA